MRILNILILTPLLLLASCGESKQPQQGHQGHAHKHDWSVKPVDSAAVAALITKNPSLGILDVRTPAEFAEGHIKGAINVDFNSPDFAEQITKINNHRPYILHCRSGSRSGKSLTTFKQNNFGTIYHLEGGFNEWKASGHPIEK